MTQDKQQQWNESYQRNEHSVMFPKEECVKFLSRFVKAKRPDGKHVQKYSKTGILTGLDFGCGIGIQTQLMHEFDIDAKGVDIVDLAIERAKNIAPNIADNFMCLTPGKALPFDDNSFDIVMSEAVLDSMTFALAKNAIQELDRTSDGITFISLISAACNHQGNKVAEDEVVKTQHEQGTIQSYYDKARVAALLAGTQYKIIWQTLHLDCDHDETKVSNARYYIVLDNRQ
jgi:SAM-dependent methyltransferase